MNKPVCIIIAGVNGAGKTTFALDFLSKLSGCKQFISADLIASGVSPLSPELKLNFASRIFLQQIKEKACQRQSFAFETTLSKKY